MGQDQLDDVSNDYRLKALSAKHSQEEYEQYFLRAPSHEKVLHRWLDVPAFVTPAQAVFNFKTDNTP